MALRIKAVLVALGYGFLVANCAGVPSDGATGEQVPRSAAIQPDDRVDQEEPTQVIPTEPRVVVTTPEVTEETGELPTTPQEVVEQVPTPIDHVAEIDQNLARLEALEIFEVGQLIVDVPAEAHNCYGPCPGFETAEEDAMAAAAQSLATLADIAEEALSQPTDATSCELSAIDANLDALAGLQVVEVGELLVAEPNTNPNCYNLPCAEDIAAADAVTCERAGILANIVASATEVLGQVEIEATPSVSELELAEAVADIDANLERLEALEIFEVGEMIADIPQEAYNCYGPCPGFETAEEDAIAAAALRLSELAAAADAAAMDTMTSGLNPSTAEVCSDEAIDANLEALADLGIVEVGDLLVVEPEYSAHCYAGMNPSETEACPEDAYEADFQTCYRAAKLAEIVEAAEEL